MLAFEPLGSSCFCSTKANSAFFIILEPCLPMFQGNQGPYLVVLPKGWRLCDVYHPGRREVSIKPYLSLTTAVVRRDVFKGPKRPHKHRDLKENTFFWNHTCLGP